MFGSPSKKNLEYATAQLEDDQFWSPWSFCPNGGQWYHPDNRLTSLFANNTVDKAPLRCSPVQLWQCAFCHLCLLSLFPVHLVQRYEYWIARNPWNPHRNPWGIIGIPENCRETRRTLNGDSVECRITCTRPFRCSFCLPLQTSCNTELNSKEPCVEAVLLFSSLKSGV